MHQPKLILMMGAMLLGACSFCPCEATQPQRAAVSMSQPVDLIASVRVATPKTGIAGNFAQGFFNLRLHRLPAGPDDFDYLNVCYRLTIENGGAARVAVWVDGSPKQVAVLRSSEISVSASTQNALKEEDIRAAEQVQAETGRDRSGHHTVVFEFGQLENCEPVDLQKEETRLIDGRFGQKEIQTWKPRSNGFEYTVTAYGLWVPRDFADQVPKEAIYVNGNRLSHVTDKGAKPYMLRWTETQFWQVGKRMFDTMERRDRDGYSVVKMEVTEVRPANPTDTPR